MMFSLENKLNWLYIDINSYFATIEQQVNPELRYKPIAIVPLVSDSTCAIAASYEAKLKGIKTGTKIYEAKKLCPDLICLQARSKLYVEYHHKIFNEIDRHLKVDHIFSIDEGACRLTGKYCLPENAIAIGKIIKEVIKNNIGEYISCSIGIASNRYLAKIASNMKKPDGLTVINPSELPQKLYNLELKELPGIGTKTKKRISNQGIKSVEQLCNLDAKKLRIIWGNVWGEKVWHLIRGADLPLEEVKKSVIGNSQVLAPQHKSVACARNILITLILKAANRLRSNELYTNSILLTIETTSQKIIKQRIKTELCCDNKSLLTVILCSWDSVVKNNNLGEVKKIAISFHGLQEEPIQMSLGNIGNQKKQQNLSKAIDFLNRKIGDNTVSIGILPNKHKTKQAIAFGHIPNVQSDK